MVFTATWPRTLICAVIVLLVLNEIYRAVGRRSASRAASGNA
jgi:hypothetical protein